MKKFISFALIAAMAVTTLVGCGNKGAKADGGSSDAAITVMSREDVPEQEELSSNCLVSKKKKTEKK